MDEQLVSQQRGLIRKRPAACRQQLQVAQKQHGDQCRPDLGFGRVGVRPEERLDPKFLLDRLGKELSCEDWRGIVNSRPVSNPSP